MAYELKASSCHPLTIKQRKHIGGDTKDSNPLIHVMPVNVAHYTTVSGIYSFFL